MRLYGRDSEVAIALEVLHATTFKSICKQAKSMLKSLNQQLKNASFACMCSVVFTYYIFSI